MIEFDREFRVVYWNPAAERIFGWTTEEVTGKVADFLLPAQRGRRPWRPGGGCSTPPAGPTRSTST